MHLCLGTTPAMQRTMIFNRFQLDEVNRAIQTQAAASGKSINVARVLTVLGENATATGFLGRDTGKTIRNDLDSAGVKHDFIETDHATRTCVTIIDYATNAVTELVEEAAPVSPAQVQALLAKFKSLLPGKKVAILSGSLAPGVGEDFYAQCCRHANAAGVAVILDARGPALRQALQFRPMVVKHNRAELADTLGISIQSDADLHGAMIELLKTGPTWAAITLGAEGAAASDGKIFLRIPPLKIKVVSPIGSGDAFAAGLAAAISRGQDLPDACRLATACAAANALTPGSGQVNFQDIQRLQPQVQIQRIAI